MKKVLLYLALVSGLVFILTSGLPYSGGSPGAKTGSPGDNNKTCTDCHGGPATSKTGWMETNIPASGYIPGDTYIITVSGTHSGVQKFGFEATAEDGQNAKAGTLIITNSSQTKLTNSNHAVTQTSSGTTPNLGTKTWSFDWTAPGEGTGAVTFYAAFNAADGNGGTSGDVIYISNITALENTSTGIEDEKLKAGVSIYPVPFNNHINVDVNNEVIVEQVSLYNTAGALVKTLISEEVTGGMIKINTGDVEPGIYIITITGTNGGHSSKRIIKN